MNHPRHIVVVILLLLVAESSFAAAGRFLTVIGQVQIRAADGSLRPATRGAAIDTGDSVITGGRGLAQLRMSDNGLISLRANTEFRLDDYAFQDDRPGVGRMLVNLLRGSFRSLTGLIGQRNRRGYAVRTPHATIGIRGTDHETHVTLRPREGFPAGTFDVVYTGGTTMTTQAGVVNIAPRQAGFVAAANQVPRVVPVPRFLRPAARQPAAPAAAAAKAAADEAGEKGAAAAAPPQAGAPGALPGDGERRVRLREGLTEEDEDQTAAKGGRPLLINPLVTPGRGTPLVPGVEGKPGTPALTPSIGTRTLAPSLGTTTTLDPSATTKTLSPTLSTDALRSPSTTTTTDTLKSLSTTPTLTSPTLSPSTTLTSPTTTSPTLSPSTTTTTTTTKTLEPSTTTISPLRTLEPTTTLRK